MDSSKTVTEVVQIIDAPKSATTFAETKVVDIAQTPITERSSIEFEVSDLSHNIGKLDDPKEQYSVEAFDHKNYNQQLDIVMDVFDSANYEKTQFDDMFGNDYNKRAPVESVDLSATANKYKVMESEDKLGKRSN